jgi:microcystin degradation protein MlrC
VRIAIGQFMEESNTFVRQRADLEHFRATQLLYGDKIAQRLRGTRAEVGGFLDVLGPAGVEVVPTVAANAVSSGPVTRATFEHFPFDDDFEPEIRAVLGPDRSAGEDRR